MGAIRVMIVDDHRLLRAGIRSLLQGAPDIEVVAEAANGPEALARAEAHRPDVILLDIAMPGMSGLELAERVAREYPGTKVVVLSMHQDEEYVRRAMLAGASGYLLKDSDIEELGLALRAVVRDETYLSPAISKQLVSEFRRQAAREADRPDGLTGRQREVLRMIAVGLTTKAIAGRMGISVKTVESHRAQLMERIGIRDVAGLVRYALRKGLVSPEE